MRRRDFLTGLAAASVLPLQGCSPFHASDECMISWFRENEASFVRLVEMARAEQTVRRIAPDFVRTDEPGSFSYPEVPSGFSLERWDVYRELFKDLRLGMGIAFWATDEIQFIATTQGLSISGSMKSYVWLSQPIDPLVDRLDALLPPEGNLPNDDYRAYRSIGGPWYLIFEAS